jgi:hypothetical protein
MNPPERVPRIFISYSHDSPEHGDRVLALADRLRAEGIDCHLDQYETSPPEGWQLDRCRRFRGDDLHRNLQSYSRSRSRSAASPTTSFRGSLERR